MLITFLILSVLYILSLTVFYVQNTLEVNDIFINCANEQCPYMCLKNNVFCYDCRTKLKSKFEEKE